MRTTIQHRQISVVLRRLLATLLVCLMVPGSVANAGSWVWCFSGSGHVAIEACGGPGCHSGSLEVANLHSDVSAHSETVPAVNPVHEDCVDVELLPSGPLVTNRSAVDDHDQSTMRNIERITLPEGFCAGLAPLDDRSTAANFEFQGASRIDPAILLRRVAVLRI